LGLLKSDEGENVGGLLCGEAVVSVMLLLDWLATE
jgi:hypothetical protein